MNDSSLRSLRQIYERIQNEPMFDDSWLIFADALEEAGYRRLARQLIGVCRRFQRFHRVYGTLDDLLLTPSFSKRQRGLRFYEALSKDNWALYGNLMRLFQR